MRILICGGPRTGKTTLANQLAAELGIAARHTDDLIGRLDWSEASLEVSRWFTCPSPWVIEGVAVPRALRKWFAQSAEKPADRVIWLGTAKVPLSGGQLSMAKSTETVMREVIPRLKMCGLGVEYR